MTGRSHVEFDSAFEDTNGDELDSFSESDYDLDIMDLGEEGRLASHLTIHHSLP
jgi:hypothetical protein